ncbi:MAG: phosphate signaling complex PhoU family protein [Nitrososphaeria archaeon]
MDIGLERLKRMIIDMADYSAETVFLAIDSYSQGKDLSDQLYNRAQQIRKMQDETNELAVEIIARYQPVASDVRFLKSCMEICYGFSRFGRYAFDIAHVLKIFGDLSLCNKVAVEEAGGYAKEMVKMSIKAFVERDVDIAKKVREMDASVDRIYLSALKKATHASDKEAKCTISEILILRYLERIADHATYIGDSVLYIVSGQQATKSSL